MGRAIGQTAVDGHGVEPALGAAAGVAQRAEEHGAAVRRPTVDLVVVAPARRQRTLGRVPGEPLRLATGRRDDIDLFVTVVLTGEGDPLTVGGETGEDLLARVGGEPGGRYRRRSDADQRSPP